MDPALRSQGHGESTDRADELLARAATLLAQADDAR